MDVLEELRQLQLLRKEQAREQAYMARVAQMEREREAQLAAAARAAAEEEEEAQGQDQDQDRELTGHREQSHQATAVPDAASPAAHGGEESGRKRRRQVRICRFVFCVLFSRSFLLCCCSKWTTKLWIRSCARGSKQQHSNLIVYFYT